ncbi:MAG: hypothetical protein GPOALKHO_000664 [Sodalis sp.]|nr:MAG: hypothetical protein GPOALKHO_000664 [Sodalis sp.]
MKIAPNNTPFLQFLSVIDFPRCVTVIQQDDDIDRCLWLPIDTLFASN